MNREEMKKILNNFEIIYTDETNWESNLIEKLTQPISYLREPTGALIPLRNILKIEKEMGCQSIVLENQYVDEDYLQEYSSFYSKSFLPYSTTTKRLHFFKDKVGYEDLLGLSGKEYLGYSVVRPILSFRTGRTVIQSPYDNGDNLYTLCRASFDVNLAGSHLKVDGSPFIQQDTNVNVCAQSAIWASSLFMNKKYGYPRYYPPQITEFATRYLTVGPPREGLTINQVVTALRDMGYNPVVFTNYDLRRSLKIIYAYIESELPVILALDTPYGGHAITVIGHDYNMKADFDFSEDFASTVDIIDHFLYHDDAEGPYRKLKTRPSNTKELSIRNLVKLMVPTPRQVTLQADDVIEHLKELLKLDTLNRFFKFVKQEEYSYSPIDLHKLVIRTYLRRSNDFKTSLPEGLSERFKFKYRAMGMPKYIWITEISRGELLKHPASNQRRIIGEVIIDSTADRHLPESWLAVHLLGRMFIRRVHKLEFDADLNEKPYPHLVRKPQP
ncbi:hypothetical protein ES702_04185 [subsurface metagenome]